MTTNKDEIREYADGWITERKGTGVPAFLKVSYLVIGLGCIVYLLVLKRGEVAHATRGLLVRQFNMTSSSADTVVYFVALLGLAFLAGLARFTFRKSDDH